MISWYLKLKGEKRIGDLIGNYKVYDGDEATKLIEEFEVLKKEFLEYYKQNNFYSVVCPVYPFPAVDIGKTPFLYNEILHSLLIATCSCACGTVPIRLIDNNKYANDLDFNTKYNDGVANAQKTTIKSSNNTPMSVQVFALSQEDEKVMGTLRQIDNI